MVGQLGCRETSVKVAFLEFVVFFKRKQEHGIGEGYVLVKRWDCKTYEGRQRSRIREKEEIRGCRKVL